MLEFIEIKLVQHWYIKQRSLSYYALHFLLLPLSWLFAALSAIRRWLYQYRVLANHQLDVPVIVIGNISVGGTGKTPLVIWLAEQLKQAGYMPGIISRGFGGKHQGEVTNDSQPQSVGDEPVLISQRTLCPVFVGSNRVLVGQELLKAYPACDVIISDDGLQHYRLARDVELAVVDGQRLFGNAYLLPAGPLRESIARLKTVDATVINGVAIELQQAFTMQMHVGQLTNVANKQMTASITDFQHKKILAVAGIGHPERFFQLLTTIGINCQTQAYPDHYVFQAIDFAKVEADIVLMTEKDAVKCTEFSQGKLAEKLWYLPVDAVLVEGEQLMRCILDKIDHVQNSEIKE